MGSAPGEKNLSPEKGAPNMRIQPAMQAAVPLVPPPLRKHLRGARILSHRNFGRFGVIESYRANPRVASNVTQEIVDYYIYDSFSVNSNTAFPKTTLFQTPEGGGKNLAATNMKAAGRLAGGNSFLALAFQVFVLNNAIPADLMSVYQNVSVILKFSNDKRYAEGLAFLYPAGCGGIVSAAAQIGTAPAGTNVIQTVSNGVPDVRNVFSWDPGLDIVTDEPIQCVFTPENTFNTSAATTPAATGLTIYAILAGKLFRPVN